MSATRCCRKFTAAALPPSPLALALLLAGGFITVFDLFVINVAIPSMEHDLGASFAEIGWIIAGYELAFGVLLIAGGKLGDRYGRRALFSLGTLGFTLASLLCALAPNATSLILARGLQGAMGAMLFPQIYALLRVMYSPQQRRQVFALLGMTLGLAAIAGQVIGGFIIEKDLFGLGWRMVFVINFPLGIATVLLARTIPESRRTHTLSIDWKGIGLVSSALLLLLFPLLQGPNSGWQRWTIFSMLAAMVLLALFIHWQRSIAKAGGMPTIDLRLLQNRAFNIGAIVVLLIYSSATSLFLCLALLLQSGLGLNAFAAGLLFAPASVAFVAASLLAPTLVKHFGTASIAAGALLYAAGIGGLIIGAGYVNPSNETETLLPALILFGFGQGLSMTPLLNLVLGHVEEHQAGMAAGLIATLQQVGGAFGVAIVGMFFIHTLNQPASHDLSQAARYADAFAHAMGYNLAATTLAACLVMAIHRKNSSTPVKY